MKKAAGLSAADLERIAVMKRCGLFDPTVMMEVPVQELSCPNKQTQSLVQQQPPVTPWIDMFLRLDRSSLQGSEGECRFRTARGPIPVTEGEDDREEPDARGQVFDCFFPAVGHRLILL